MRVQVILALVAALVLVAVPLYLWRRPQPANIPSADAATNASGAAAVMPPPAISGEPANNGQLVQPPSGPAIQIAPVKTLKCQDPGSGRTPPERCDGIRFFEDALTRAIKDAATCAPPSKSGYVASFTLDMHFGKKKTKLWFGKSTTLNKSRRKELLRCVERAMQTPEWDRIPHQHLSYTINAVATYPSIAPPDDAGGSPAPKATPKPAAGSPNKTTKPKKPAAPAPKKPKKP